MRWWIAFVFLGLGARTGAQAPEREAPPVDDAHVRRLEAVGRAASDEAQRTLDERVLPFDLTWGLR